MKGGIYMPTRNTDAYGTAKNPVRQKHLQELTYTDSDGVVHKYPVLGQGPHRVVMKADGTILDQDAYDRDVVGYTNPDLHRRVDPQKPPEPTDPNYDQDDPKSVDRSYLNQEIEPRKYELGIQGVHSYRTTTYTVHDEESTTTEIP